MWKKIKAFFIEWERHIEGCQDLEIAYRYCKLYDKGKINKKTFNSLLESLDRRK